MKYKLHYITAVFFLCAAAHADFRPRIVDMELNKAYIPIGFDDNDNVQVMVTGVFNNTCYRVGPTTVHVDETTKTIQIRQSAYDYGFECLQIELPFAQVVNIGLVPAGTGGFRIPKPKRLGGFRCYARRAPRQMIISMRRYPTHSSRKSREPTPFQLHLEGCSRQPVRASKKSWCITIRMSSSFSR